MIEWDEAARQDNLAGHGVDFVRAARMFDHPVLEREDDRQFHGERRYIALGMAGGMVLVATWTPRGNRRRLIAVWKGDADDEAVYRTAFPGQAGAHAGFDPFRRALPGQSRKGVLAHSLARLALPQPEADKDPAGP